MIYVSDYGAVGDGNFYTVSEWMVGGQFDRGYETFQQLQVDYPHVTGENDGLDWAALQSAFNDLGNGGEISFTDGEVYVLDDIVRVQDVSFDAYMYDATVKMAPGSIYNAFEIKAVEQDALEYVNWHGGTFDGNKDNVDWAGSTSPDTNFQKLPDDFDRSLSEDRSTWRFEGEIIDSNLREFKSLQVEANNGLLGIKHATNVLVEGVTIKSSISDGVVLTNVEYGVVKDSFAYDGAPFNFNDALYDYGRGIQSTYFKARQTESRDFDGGTFVIDNVHTEGGSIGYQFSSAAPYEEVLPDSHLIIKNSSSQNAMQDAVHVEHALRVDISDSFFFQDASEYFNRIFIGNKTEFASIDNVEIFGNEINFNEASDLISGIVHDSLIVNEFDNTDYGIRNATHVINSVVQVAGEYGIFADHVENTHILGFSKAAIKGAKYINDVVIDNAAQGGVGIALQNFSGEQIVGSSISNVDKGVTLRSGDVQIVDSVFKNIGGHALEVVDLDSLTLDTVLFEAYGMASSGLSGDAAVGARANWGADEIRISDTTQFISSTGNPEFDDYRGLENIKYCTANPSGSHQANDADHNDELFWGAQEDDFLFGRNGNDIILGGDGNDKLYGRNGSDTILGGSGNDTLHGQNGRDSLYGGDGDDHLFGGSGTKSRDTLYGGTGNDVLSSGDGKGILHGGQGADVFVLTEKSDGSSDQIRDFSHHDGDKIDISGFLTDAALNAFSMSEFVRITHEHQNAKSILWIDADGAGTLMDFEKHSVFHNLENQITSDDFLF